MARIGIVSEKLYRFIMKHFQFSRVFKAWIWAYFHILPHGYLCRRYVNGEILFKYHVAPTLLPSCVPLIGEEVCSNTDERVEFYGFVTFFLDEVLKHPKYFLQVGGVHTGGGFGLVSKERCLYNMMSNKIVGLLEPLSPELSLIMKNEFHYQSLFQNPENKKAGVFQVLYGPASLLNNDTQSALKFTDSYWLNGSPVHFVVESILSIPFRWQGYVNTPLSVPGVKMMTSRADANTIIEPGQHILVNYQDPTWNVCDLTSEETAEEDTSPKHKRAKVVTSSSSSSSSSPDGTGDWNADFMPGSSHRLVVDLEDTDEEHFNEAAVSSQATSNGASNYSNGGSV